MAKIDQCQTGDMLKADIEASLLSLKCDITNKNLVTNTKKLIKRCLEKNREIGISNELKALCIWEVLYDAGYVHSRIEVSEKCQANVFKVNLIARNIAANKILKKKLSIQEEVLDVLAVIHQDGNQLMEKVLHFMQMCLENNVQLKVSNALVAFSIWEVLNQEKCPFSKVEIGYLCGVHPAFIQRMAKHARISSTFSSVSRFVFRFTRMMGLSKTVGVFISKVVSIYDNSLHLPETIIGSVLLNTQNYLKSKFNLVFSPRISLQNLSKIFGVSETSIMKCANANRNDHIRQIEIYIDSFLKFNEKDVRCYQ